MVATVAWLCLQLRGVLRSLRSRRMVARRMVQQVTHCLLCVFCHSSGSPHVLRGTTPRPPMSRRAQWRLCSALGRKGVVEKCMLSWHCQTRLACYMQAMHGERCVTCCHGTGSIVGDMVLSRLVHGVWHHALRTGARNMEAAHPRRL
jgi:hypothetical protein